MHSESSDASFSLDPVSDVFVGVNETVLAIFVHNRVERSISVGFSCHLHAHNCTHVQMYKVQWRLNLYKNSRYDEAIVSYTHTKASLSTLQSCACAAI